MQLLNQHVCVIYSGCNGDVEQSVPYDVWVTVVIVNCLD